MSIGMRRAFSFTAIVLGFFIALLDTTITNIALPEMTRFFGGNVTKISWVMNGYNLAFAVFILTAARLADQFGRKRVFIVGVALFTVTSLLAGFAPTLGVLIVLRVLQGLAGAIIVPVTFPLTTTTFPKEMHGTIIGIWGAVSGVAAASGPALGGVIMQHLDWKWIFFVNVPLGLLSIVLTLRFIDESRDDSASRRIDYFGIAGISAAMFCISYTLIKVQDYGWDSNRTIIGLVAGALFLALFVLIQWKAEEPMLPLSLLRFRSFDGAVLTMLIVGAALMNISLLTSFFLTRMMGMTELKAGLLLSVVALSSMFSSAISGPLSAKYGSNGFAALGIALMTCAAYWLSGLHADSSLADVILRLVLAGLGTGFTMAPVMSSTARNVPEEKVGIASGAVNMAKALGSVIGVAIIVTALQGHMDDGQREAGTKAVRAIEADAALQPFLRAVVLNAASSGGSGEGASKSEADLSAALMEQADAAVAKLGAEEQQAFLADREGQLNEAGRLLAQAGLSQQHAAERAFSRTYELAGMLMIPGILFALTSDKRRKEKQANANANAENPPFPAAE